MKFPDDENGDVLRSMLESGMDFSKAYDIEFLHLFDDQSGAERMAQAVTKIGHNGKVSYNEFAKGWDCMVVVNMKPTHEGITSTEELLGKIAIEHGGKSDGWGVLQE